MDRETMRSLVGCGLWAVVRGLWGGMIYENLSLISPSGIKE